MASFERRNEKTEYIDYSEIYYLNDNNEPEEKEIATRFILREIGYQGELVNETIGMIWNEKKRT